MNVELPLNIFIIIFNLFMYRLAVFLYLCVPKGEFSLYANLTLYVLKRKIAAKNPNENVDLWQ